jgi:hypothetical protein
MQQPTSNFEAFTFHKKDRLVRLKEIINHLTHNCHIVKCTLGIAIKIEI